MDDKEKRLEAEEKIMAAVCDVCHWPHVYRDEEIMYAEKCDYCPAALAVANALGLTEEDAADV